MVQSDSNVNVSFITHNVCIFGALVVLINNISACE